ncbi:MAG: hypothetical protein KGJ86_00545 [Chloroflexota bacterium]|nr:hypothetical protein [Chloroflexota bacterium]
MTSQTATAPSARIVCGTCHEPYSLCFCDVRGPAVTLPAPAPVPERLAGRLCDRCLHAFPAAWQGELCADCEAEIADAGDDDGGYDPTDDELTRRWGRAA